MTTRTRKNEPGLADLEGATNPADIPSVMPPPGVEGTFETRVRYQRMINPNEAGNYSDELRGLAADEYEDLPEPSPQDPYTEFVNTWRKYHGYPLKIVRLPDPADKRMPGHTYNSPCFELTMLSDMPFDPNNLIGMLQVINNNSGGVFRIFLTGEAGTPVPGARLDRLVVADPPRQYSQQRPRQTDDYDFERERYYRREREPQPPPALPPQKSETEIYIEQMQRELFQKVMMRALDPPTPVAIDPLSTIPEGDRLALSLLRQGDLLPTLVERISSLAQAPDRIESATWKDKLADASIQLVTHNPRIVATITDIISRATVAFATAFAPRAQQSQVVAEPIVIQHPPAQRVPAPQLPYQGGRVEPLTSSSPQALDGLPETNQPIDDGLDVDEDAEIDMMEEIVKLLLSEKPLDLQDPIILDIREAYPKIFDTAMAGLATMPSATIIQYLCAKSDFCADLFNSQRNGLYLKQRLEELKTLLGQPINAAQATNENTADEAS